MDTFTLEIRLGNEAMRTREDVAQALRDTAARLEPTGIDSDSRRANIRDINGNTVGEWDAGLAFDKN